MVAVACAGMQELTAVKVGKVCDVSGHSTPQLTLTPQSSCADFETNSSIVSSHEAEHDFQNIRPAEAFCKPIPAWLTQQGTSKKQARRGGVRARKSQHSRGHQAAMTAGIDDVAQSVRSQLRARGDVVLASVRDSSDCTRALAGPAEQGVPSTALCLSDASHDQQQQRLPWCAKSSSPAEWSRAPSGRLHSAGAAALSRRRCAGFDFGRCSYDEPENIRVGVLAAEHLWEGSPMKVHMASLASSSQSTWKSEGLHQLLPFSVAPPPGL